MANGDTQVYPTMIIGNPTPAAVPLAPTQTAARGVQAASLPPVALPLPGARHSPTVQWASNSWRGRPVSLSWHSPPRQSNAIGPRADDIKPSARAAARPSRRPRQRLEERTSAGQGCVRESAWRAQKATGSTGAAPVRLTVVAAARAAAGRNLAVHTRGAHSHLALGSLAVHRDFWILDRKTDVAPGFIP